MKSNPGNRAMPYRMYFIAALAILFTVAIGVVLLTYALHSIDPDGEYYISATPKNVLAAFPSLLPQWRRLVCTIWLALMGLGLGTFCAAIVGLSVGLCPDKVPYWIHFVNALRAIPLTLLIPFLAVFPVVLALPPGISGDAPGRNPIWLITLGTFLYILIGVAEGLRNRNKERERIFKTIYHFSRKRYLFCILIPESLPYVLSAMRLASLFAFVLAIVVEPIVQYPGIGKLISDRFGQSTKLNHYPAEAIALLCVVAIVGIGIDCIFVLGRELLLKWNQRDQA